MNRVFIDLGCHAGDTVEQFINWGQLLGDIKDFDVYAFDPNPNFGLEWQDVHDRHIKHVTSINFSCRAAWIKNEDILFSEDQAEHKLGSTLMPAKANTWPAGTKYKVKAFDFSKWLQQFEGREIYIKFDIEGAEYPLLKKMVEDGTDKLVKGMFIEWHAGKMGKEYLDQESWIKENLACPWLEWR